MPRANRKANLTKRFIEKLVPGKKRITIYDEATRHLGVMVMPSGHKSYFWFAKVDGHPTWKTIANCDDVSVERARAKAGEYNTGIANWKLAEYKGPNPLECKAEPTLKAALDRYAEDLKAKGMHKAARDVLYNANKYFPQLLGRKLSTVRPEHVQALHSSIVEKGHGHLANRVAQVIRATFNYAIKKKTFTGTNPCAGLDWFHEEERQRALLPTEANAFFTQLAKERGDLPDFVWLCLSTAARKSNVLSMRWDELSVGQGGWVWTVPASKAKSGKAMAIPLVDQVLPILKRRRAMHRESEWVFPSVPSVAGGIKSKSGHVESIRSWRPFLERAGIENLRIHDLRRSAGAWMISSDVPIATVSRSLHHSDISITSKVYTPFLSDTPIRQAFKTALDEMKSAARRSPRKLLEVGRA